MASKKIASFLVILWPVRTNVKKESAAKTRKILAMAKGEKSAICIGQIKATIPKTRVEQTTTEPIKSPKISQPSPFLAEIMEKYISGKQLPRPTIKIPI